MLHSLVYTIIHYPAASGRNFLYFVFSVREAQYILYKRKMCSLSEKNVNFLYQFTDFRTILLIAKHRYAGSTPFFCLL